MIKNSYLLDFKNNNEKYSVNKNGIFINISTVRKATIKDISNFIYCMIHQRYPLMYLYKSCY